MSGNLQYVGPVFHEYLATENQKSLFADAPHVFFRRKFEGSLFN